MYEVEHKDLFDSIRAGSPINNGTYMCLSSALGIMAQIACYTGGMITWSEVMRSQAVIRAAEVRLERRAPVKPGADGRYPTAMQRAHERKRWLM